MRVFGGEPERHAVLYAADVPFVKYKTEFDEGFPVLLMLSRPGMRPLDGAHLARINPYGRKQMTVTGVLSFDGGSYNSGRGGAHGRPASAGYVLTLHGVQKAVGIPLPPDISNNTAEFTGLIEGLKELREAGVTYAHIIGDSQFVIRAMTGEYRIKMPHLKPLLVEARRLCEGIDIHWEWVRRENNSLADAMCRKAANVGAKVVDIL